MTWAVGKLKDFFFFFCLFYLPEVDDGLVVLFVSVVESDLLQLSEVKCLRSTDELLHFLRSGIKRKKITV